MGTSEHRGEAKRLGPVRYAVITVSDSRTEETDGSGRLARRLLDEAGHNQAGYRLLKNDPAAIREAVLDLLGQPLDCIVITGGTGVGRRDVTIETVSPLLEKTLPGFGELFRHLSYGEIGPAALMSRAICGTARGRVLVCLPGAEDAVRLALSKLLIPELQHLVWVASR